MATWGKWLFGVIGLDLLLRAIPEILGIGSLVGLPAVVNLFTRQVLGVGTIGWFYGWILLWVAIFELTPVFFPEQSPDWTASVPNRFLTATISVIIGVALEGGIAVSVANQAQEQVVPSGFPVPAVSATPPVTIPPTWIVVVFVFLLIGYGTLRLLEPGPIEHQLLYTPPSWARFNGQIGVDTYVLVILFLSLALTATSLMFPVPELLIILIQVTNTLDLPWVAVIGTESLFSELRDVIGYLSGMVLSVYLGLKVMFHPLYILLPIAYYAVFVASITEVGDFGALFGNSPFVTALLIVCIFVVGARILANAMRLGMRAREDVIKASERPDRAGMNQDAEYDRSRTKRLPLFLLPSACILAGLVLMVAVAQPSGEVVVETLRLTPTVTTLLIIGFSLLALALYRPERLRFPSVPDHAAAVFGAQTMVILPVLGMFLPDLNARGLTQENFTWLIRSIASSFILLSLWIGPQALLKGSSDDVSDQDESKRLAGGIVSAVAILVVVWVIDFLVAAFASLFSNPVAPIIAASFIIIDNLTTVVLTIVAVNLIIFIPLMLTRTIYQSIRDWLYR